MGASPDTRRRVLANHIEQDHKVGFSVTQEAVIKDRLYIWHRDCFPDCKWTINQGLRDLNKKER